MKIVLMILAAVTSVQALALSNNEICGAKAKEIAGKIQSSKGTVKVDFKGDLTGIQQLDGVYELTYNNGTTAELRLDQFCNVLEYRVK